MFDLTFPKYKPRVYNTGNSPSGKVWAILKRKWLCFYKPMTHTKSVWKATDPFGNYHLSSSHEVLMFGSEEDVESEIDRLGFGEPPIVRRIWKNHKILEEQYESNIDSDR